MPRSTRRNTKSHKNTRGHKNLSMTRPKKRTYKMKSKRRTSKKNRTRRFKKRGGMEPDELERRLVANLYDSDGNEKPEIAERIAEIQFQKKLDQLIADAKSKGKTTKEIDELVKIEERNREKMRGPHFTDIFKDPKIADEQFQKKLDQLIANAKRQRKSPDEIAKLVESEREKRKLEIIQGAHLTDKFEDPKKEMATPGDRRQPKTGSLAPRRK